MKNAVACCAFALFSLGSASISLADGKSADIEKAVAALEMKWTQGESTNNPDQIAPLLADKMILTDTDGKSYSRGEFLALEKSTKFTASALSDLKVTVFGNTAIASYVLSQTGTDNNGAFDRHARETDTWVKMPNGNWQVVAAHSSTIKKK